MPEVPTILFVRVQNAGTSQTVQRWAGDEPSGRVATLDGQLGLRAPA